MATYRFWFFLRLEPRHALAQCLPDTSPRQLVGVEYVDNQPARGEAFRQPIRAWTQQAVYKPDDPTGAPGFGCRVGEAN